MTAAVPPDVGELRRLEAAATGGVWFAEQRHDEYDGWDVLASVPGSPPDLTPVAHDNDREEGVGACDRVDAALIVALRNSASWLLGQAEAAQRARAIHVRGIYRTAICASCGDEWPCPTIRALEGDPDATG